VEYPDGIISSQKSPVVAGLFAFCNFYLSVRYDHMKAIEYIFLPSRVYRGEIEQQLDACYSLEEAHDLVVKNAGELYQGCTPEEMREILDEGPKVNVYSMKHFGGTADDHPNELLYYPEGNGNWPVQIQKIKLVTPLYLK